MIQRKINRPAPRVINARVMQTPKKPCGCRGGTLADSAKKVNDVTNTDTMKEKDLEQSGNNPKKDEASKTEGDSIVQHQTPNPP